MSKSNKVIKRSLLPTNLPLFKILMTGLALDYWNAPSWLWGSLGVIFLIALIAGIHSISTETQVDINLNEEKKGKQSKFKERLEKMME